MSPKCAQKRNVKTPYFGPNLSTLFDTFRCHYPYQNMTCLPNNPKSYLKARSKKEGLFLNMPGSDFGLKNVNTLYTHTVYTHSTLLCVCLATPKVSILAPFWVPPISLFCQDSLNIDWIYCFFSNRLFVLSKTWFSTVTLLKNSSL